MRSGQKDETVTLAEAARRLGMTQAGVAKYAERPGAPVEMKAGRRRCFWPAFPVWYRQQLVHERERPTSFDEAKARKMQADAELAELDLESKRGELVPIDLHREEVRTLVRRVRAQLLAVPGRYAPRTAGKASLPESQRAWDAAVRDILNDLRENGNGGA